MKITERRIVRQEWYETDTTKTGWDSHGWVFNDTGATMNNEQTIVSHIQLDKHYNPILGIAEKEIEV